MNRWSDIGYAFVLVLLSVLVAGCGSIRKLPERLVLGDPFSKLYHNLNTIADVERIGKEELIVRFPDAALFGVNEYLLRTEAMRDLENVVTILRRYPGFIVIVEGHTDNRGRESYNQWLSERRSRIVADFLVNSGLDPAIIQVVGYGESRPLSTNKTPAGRQRNRRVEIHIKPQQLQPDKDRADPETDSPRTMIPASMAA